ncbi:MAG: GNAT family N-acetyltransferase [Actinomycetota bacterium]
MTEPSIRRAGISDARQIAEVHVRGWRWGYRDILPPEVLDSLSVERREQGWNEILGSLPPGAAVLVAEVRGRIVGFAGTGPSRDEDAHAGSAELSSLYVEEEVAGTGVGRALMTAAIEFARSTGFRELTLWVLERNARARRFYEAAGLLPDGSAKQEMHPTVPVVLEEIRYRRSLG